MTISILWMVSSASVFVSRFGFCILVGEQIYDFVFLCIIWGKCSGFIWLIYILFVVVCSPFVGPESWKIAFSAGEPLAQVLGTSLEEGMGRCAEHQRRFTYSFWAMKNVMWKVKHEITCNLRTPLNKITSEETLWWGFINLGTGSWLGCTKNILVLFKLKFVPF